MLRAQAFIGTEEQSHIRQRNQDDISTRFLCLTLFLCTIILFQDSGLPLRITGRKKAGPQQRGPALPFDPPDRDDVSTPRSR
jgi:hypothetical protein